MTLLESIALGILEGATEFLPISSTAHLILGSTLLGIEQTDFTKTFEITIQLGAILAVVCLYWRSFLNVALLKKLAAAFIPTGVIGLLAYPLLKSHLLESTELVLAALFLGGVALIVFERWHVQNGTRAEPEEPLDARITYRQALLVGLCQSIAIIPGVSRSGATIVGGMLLGLARPTIVEFSFLLAVPTMLVATGFDMLNAYSSFSGSDWGALTAGFISAFLVALLAIRWLLAYVRKHSFTAFGVYRIALALVFAVFLFL